MSWIQLGNDIDGESINDQSGFSISLNSSGNILAIGAYYNDGNGIDSGHVRVYFWNGSSWVQRGNDIDGEIAGDWSGYSVDLNSDGDILAIGAILNDGNGTSSGHVRVYIWNGTSWNQRGNDINGEAALDYSGYSVSINSAGDLLAIGAVLNDGTGSSSGHVRIYYWNGSNWVQRGTDINGEASSDQSGYSISLNSAGDLLAIGAYLNDGNGSDSGHVRVYYWNGSNWVQRGTDINGESAGDYSGYSVSLNANGDLLAIGAILNDGNGIDSGHTRVYFWNGTSWVQRGADINGEASNDYSGHSVSLNSVGDKLAIGAVLNSGNGIDSGHVRIYSWNGTNWTQIGSDINGETSGDYSGYNVSLSSTGDIVAIGAIYNDGNGTDSGQTRVYSFSTATTTTTTVSPTTTTTTTVSPTTTTTTTVSPTTTTTTTTVPPMTISSWQNVIPIMVRYLINDTDYSNYKYTDTRIEQTVVIGAQFVNLELDFSNLYTIDIANISISPDPANSATKDDSFINLVSLKAACIILGSEVKTESANAISIRDGQSSIDLRGVSSALASLYKDLCDKYSKLADDYRFTGGTGTAILGPYSPGSDFISRTNNDQDFRGNYFRY